MTAIPRWRSGSRTCTACPPRSACAAPADPYYHRDMPAWLIWALAAVLLAVGEILTPGLFFLGPVALAAVAAGVVAAVGLGIAAQLVVFIAGSVASVLFLRPLARRHVHMPAALRT